MYHVDPIDSSIVIDTFNQGIGASPYVGLTDMQSVDPLTVPGEVSVSLATQSSSQAPAPQSQTTTVSMASDWLLIPVSLKVESRQAIIFSSVGTSGLTMGQVYWLFYTATVSTNNTYQLSTTYETNSPASISADSSVTWSIPAVGIPKYFQTSTVNNWMVDANGLVWSDKIVTAVAGGVTATKSWTYTGNPTDSTSKGNGLLVYRTIHNDTGATGTTATFDEFLFVWRNGQIDYTKIYVNNSNVSLSWVLGWNPALSSSTTEHSAYLQNSSTINNSHMAITTLPNLAVYCDSFFVSTFFQNIPTASSDDYIGFDPTTPSTYTFATFNILPPTDVAQCLAFINQYVFIGGKGNYIYPWNAAALDKQYTAPIIILPESNVVNIVNVGNNGYIFAGNRGNIYVTNGSQTSLFAKVPDHLSNTIEPYFIWGGATYNKNRLYFGVNAISPVSGGGSFLNYPGLWCVDLTTQAIFNCNQFLYNATTVYVSALIVPTLSGNGPNPFIGYGLLMGWSDNGNNSGIDISIGTPYTGGQSWVTSDMIPIGTLFKPTTPLQIEFKLSKPLVTGETIQIQTGKYLDMTYASFLTQFTTNTVGIISDSTGNHGGMGDDKYQWMLVRAILTSTNTTPSYNRVTQLRIVGGAKKQTSYSSVA